MGSMRLRALAVLSDLSAKGREIVVALQMEKLPVLARRGCGETRGVHVEVGSRVLLEFFGGKGDGDTDGDGDGEKDADGDGDGDGEAEADGDADGDGDGDGEGDTEAEGDGDADGDADGEGTQTWVLDPRPPFLSPHVSLVWPTLRW